MKKSELIGTDELSDVSDRVTLVTVVTFVDVRDVIKPCFGFSALHDAIMLKIVKTARDLCVS